MAAVFVDTNVLVYSVDRHEAAKHEVAKALMVRLWQAREGTLSTQVLKEFYSVATRKIHDPLPKPIARRLVARYGAWPLVQVDPELIVQASLIDERNQISFRDALIVAAARRAGVARIVSEDLGHGRVIEGIPVEDPFR